jgi:hypothetical protein
MACTNPGVDIFPFQLISHPVFHLHTVAGHIVLCGDGMTCMIAWRLGLFEIGHSSPGGVGYSTP